MNNAEIIEKGVTERRTVLRAYMLTALIAFVMFGAVFMSVETVEAKPSNGTPCLNCHTGVDGDSTLDGEIWDGTSTTPVAKNGTAAVTVPASTPLEIDWRCTNTTRAANNDGGDVYIAVPSGWGVAAGTRSPGIGGWNANWDNAVTVGSWNTLLTGGSPDYAGYDHYTIDFDIAGSIYSIGKSGALCDEGGSGCTDPDGIADNLGGDARVTVGSSSGTIYIHCIGHMEGGGGKGTKAYTLAQIDVTVSGTKRRRQDTSVTA